MTGDRLRPRNTHSAKTKEYLPLSLLVPNIVPKINHITPETKNPSISKGLNDSTWRREGDSPALKR